MKVRLLISRAGAGFAQSAGEVIEVSDAEAKRMFEANPPQAVPAERDGEKPERAVAARQKPRSKRKGE